MVDLLCTDQYSKINLLCLTAVSVQTTDRLAIVNHLCQVALEK